MPVLGLWHRHRRHLRDLGVGARVNVCEVPISVPGRRQAHGQSERVGCLVQSAASSHLSTRLALRLEAKLEENEVAKEPRGRSASSVDDVGVEEDERACAAAEAVRHVRIGS